MEHTDITSLNFLTSTRYASYYYAATLSLGLSVCLFIVIGLLCDSVVTAKMSRRNKVKDFDIEKQKKKAPHISDGTTPHKTPAKRGVSEGKKSPTASASPSKGISFKFKSRLFKGNFFGLGRLRKFKRKKAKATVEIVEQPSDFPTTSAQSAEYQSKPQFQFLRTLPSRSSETDSVKQSEEWVQSLSGLYSVEMLADSIVQQVLESFDSEDSKTGSWDSETGRQSSASSEIKEESHRPHKKRCQKEKKSD
ncbi:uncharacterized protein LOC122811050 [Protopterus annectens]|uniref:uncharacterized protein LOC122811050 n=1 Tax=Protopterus annectens TaxID=7888 RepID=UPI001CFB7FBB|nr:uncharacterized protein LOC122811050 [Protopterus annectens]